MFNFVDNLLKDLTRQQIGEKISWKILLDKYIRKVSVITIFVWD